MKHTVKRCAALLAAGGMLGCLAGCQASGADWRPHPTSPFEGESKLELAAVDGLPEDFILGMDASCVPALEAGGVRYYDRAGNEADVFAILNQSGINYIRVRVWNDPFDAEGHGYGGGNCDIENAVLIGRRATAQGMKLLVDFHYSDFWADPAKQVAPKAWQGMTLEQKADALYRYTKESLQRLVDEGVEIGMVQIGNETNGALCGEVAVGDDWESVVALMSQGAKAVREVCPGALVVIHFSNPEKTGRYAHYARMLEKYSLDYDVFASSYYPYWHGTLDNLSSLLSEIALSYGKKVMVAETSYAYTLEDTDFFGNTLGTTATPVEGYPFSVQGQADFVRDVVDTVVNRTEGGIGVFYWEGTWISVGTHSYEQNRQSWERFGTGWASSFAAEYDAEDAGRWYGGCAVENQALFDEHGRATDALCVFALMRDSQREGIE